MPEKPDYGFDAPYALIGFSAAALAFGVVSVYSFSSGQTRQGTFSGIYALFFLGNAASFFYTTRAGKFIEWERILDGLGLTGVESVLDIGCGRGAVLTAVARRLTTGSVTGVDIWNVMDQSGNAREVTLRNAAIAGVTDRVRIETGDMRTLPFGDGSFDVIVSSLAIHNLSATSDRRTSIEQAWRVLKPGGRIVIADIRATALYANTLRALGGKNVTRRRLGWRFWWGNPFAATTLVTGVKV